MPTAIPSPATLSPVIRILQPADWPTYRDLRLGALAEAPYAFGSTYAEESQRADDVWAARLAAPALGGFRRACPLVAEVAGEPVGLVWIKLDGAGTGTGSGTGTASLYQVWVAPQARGLGVGAALLDAAIAWARGVRATAVHLDVTVGNGAAERLYARAGFVPVGAPVPQPGKPLFEQAMTLALA